MVAPEILTYNHNGHICTADTRSHVPTFECVEDEKDQALLEIG